MPHARGIPWRFRLTNVQPTWLRRARTGGGRKFTRRVGLKPPALSSAGFFSAERLPDGWAGAAGMGRQREASRSAGAFARRRDAPPRVHGPASPIRALSRAGFAAMCLGRISGGLISQLTDGIREALFDKGTMGTWEQARSDRQKASPLRAASLFPSIRADSGTWEQKWPIPMQENPRACGSPVPPPAVERQ